MTDEMKPEVKKVVDTLMDLARETFDKDGKVLPRIYFGGADHKIIGVIQPDFSTDKAKDETARVVRELLYEHKATFVLNVAESWSIRPEDTEDFMKNRDKYPSVSSYPKRIEVICGNYESYEDGVWGTMIAIEEADGKKTLGPTQYFKFTQSKGRFTNWLPPRGKSGQVL